LDIKEGKMNVDQAGTRNQSLSCETDMYYDMSMLYIHKIKEIYDKIIYDYEFNMTSKKFRFEYRC
jgi:hypothetical protein